MAYTPEKRHEARGFYVHNRVPLLQCAERVGVSLSTARRWKRDAKKAGDDWDTARTASSMSGQGATDLVQQIVTDYTTMHHAVMVDLREDKDIPPIAKANVLSMLSDTFSKTMAAAGRASPQLSKLAVAQEVVQILGDHAVKNHPESVPALLEVLESAAPILESHYA